MKKSLAAILLPLLLLAGGCATVPTGPRVMALPGTGKTFEQFRFDDNECRQYASYRVGGTTPNQAATDSTVRSAAVGTVVGAVAGAAIGGHQGAGVGAGTGLLVGSVAGADASRSSAYGNAQQYDNAYIQCMYAKGHQVPVSGARISRLPQQQPAATPPPPPPGSPPPPPPEYLPR